MEHALLVVGVCGEEEHGVAVFDEVEGGAVEDEEGEGGGRCGGHCWWVGG